MKTTSRIALAGRAWDGNSAQRKVAARVRLREDRPAPRPAAAVRDEMAQPDSMDAAAASATRYEITCITAEFDAPHWAGTWRVLVAASRSSEKIYQTPEFFRFLADTRTSDSDQFELFAIRDRSTDKVVGMVPVRLAGIALDARVGNCTLGQLQRRVIRLLGSVPMMPDDPALLQQLFDYLLTVFPDCAAVSMQAFPAEMQARLAGDRRHRALVVHGWRACHTIPLPASPAAYLAKLSGKKRYNLARQHRLLEQAAGPLELVRIDRSADVRDLVAGIAALSAGATGHGMTARDYRVLAANRLLLSYVLKSGDDVIAVIAGSRYGDTWHVHQILYAQQFRHLSAGAVAMHSALQSVIADFAFTAADFGYGAPRHSFASTHVLKQRGHVMVVRKASAARLLLGAFVRYDNWHAACVRVLRPFILRPMPALRRSC